MLIYTLNGVFSQIVTVIGREHTEKLNYEELFGSEHLLRSKFAFRVIDEQTSRKSPKYAKAYAITLHQPDLFVQEEMIVTS